jgi:hypothetical protein
MGKARRQSPRCDERIVEHPWIVTPELVNAPACATTPTDDVAYRIRAHAARLMVRIASASSRKAILRLKWGISYYQLDCKTRIKGSDWIVTKSLFQAFEDHR